MRDLSAIGTKLLQVLNPTAETAVLRGEFDRISFFRNTTLLVFRADSTF